MGSVYTELAELTEKETDFVLCRIEQTSGSTPRSKGAVMAVFVCKDDRRDLTGGDGMAVMDSITGRDGLTVMDSMIGGDNMPVMDSMTGGDGSGSTLTGDNGSIPSGNGISKYHIIGSVGGGRPEYECIQKAGALLSKMQVSSDIQGKCEESAVILHFDMYPGDINVDNGTGDRKNGGSTEYSGSAENCGSGGYVCGGSMDVSLLPVRKDDAVTRRKVLEMAESHVRRRVYIFGGGHVARALVPVLEKIDFMPVVYESRPEYTEKEMFPEAEEVICAGFDDIFRHVDLKKEDYVAIMTRGHEDDHTVLRQILTTDVEYIGLMGSRSKRKFIYEKLKEEGFSEADTARIHNPIGLDIGSETPQEIAISIAAELIQTRNKSGTEDDHAAQRQCGFKRS